MLLLSYALAADPAPAVPPAPPVVPAAAPAAPTDPTEDAIPVAGAENVLVVGDLEVKKARDELVLKLREEGYKRSERKGEYTVFKPDVPWHPQVWLHDDGWLTLKRQPPRIHSPGHSFADQGSPLNYLWCVPTLMTACVSVGGWTIGERKYTAIKSDILDATRDDVQKLNDAVVRQHLGIRLYKDIPGDLDKLWRDATQPPIVRRRMIFLYWDSRVDNDAGFAAKEAIKSFILGVVQPSAEPYSAAELGELNALRQSQDPLELAGLGAGTPPAAPASAAPAPAH
jgi:hypothetical protein